MRGTPRVATGMGAVSTALALCRFRAESWLVTIHDRRGDEPAGLEPLHRDTPPEDVHKGRGRSPGSRVVVPVPSSQGLPASVTLRGRKTRR